MNTPQVLLVRRWMSIGKIGKRWMIMSKYTPTPMITRPRCPNCNRKLYWDGEKAKWWCYVCEEFFTRKSVEPEGK